MKTVCFFRPQKTKFFALATFLLICFTLTNCKQEAESFDEQLTQATGSAKLDVLAKQYPENLFLNKELGVKGRYIVMLKDSYLRPAVMDEQASEARPTELSDRSAGRRQEVEAGVGKFLDEKGISRQKVVATYGQLISGFTADLTDAQLESLLADVRVASIEQDMEIALNDKLETGKGVEGEPKTQTVPCGIVRHGGAGNGSESNKWIWIVDTGIDSDHPDLNVQTDPNYAKSFVGGSFEDCYGHGTHVAGTAAAKNNTFGVVGMSAGAKVVPIKIMSSCTKPTYSNSTLLSALSHIASKDIPGDVVNMSIGGYFGFGCSIFSPLRAAIQNLGTSGTWVVIAAGNDAAYAGNYQPACIDGTRVLTIANMTCQNVFNNGSNYNLSTGGSPVDWIAVGTSVYSTYKYGGYATMTGTSMSTPHVAGIVHWRQANPLQNGSVVKSGVVYKVASRT